MRDKWTESHCTFTEKNWIFQDISVSVSVLTLTFIAYDRYNAICRPLKFSARKTKAAVVIAVIWTISSLIGIPDAVTLNLYTPMNKTEYPCMADDILFDLSRCSPSWDPSVDFSFTIIKVIDFSNSTCIEDPISRLTCRKWRIHYGIDYRSGSRLMHLHAYLRSRSHQRQKKSTCT